MWSIEWCRFQLFRMTTNPHFKGTQLLNAEYLRNGTRQRRSYSETY